ncbi:hypothetical protein AMAG_14658 [Allomyces macrogynus ATCC 38327]|uniref:Outer arm dynein light chain 1 n=1 Tax=Allomyces macrogynus (strain ATCC 38327) TaxID=578462 RepID=A0A0L0T730_ALLM3|nr:hypothetical protein AMAG_14658 [Allomyces macrogynus ATCC 38327]|eukprot:KNE70535.1 hypothetical protein AMAG_14658 [Allomyces macrogynus ATCC 38327]
MLSHGGGGAAPARVPFSARKSKKQTDAKGFTLMTLPYLVELAKEQKGYVTPALNDHLYLHFKGFAQISEDIAQYSGLKTLWLEGNALSELRYLDALTELKCLYIQENVFEHLDGISRLVNLTILNVSNNLLTALPAELADLPHLASLHASNNKLIAVDSVAVLARCAQLSVVDLHHNQLADTRVVTDVLYAMPSLAVLTLHHNPVTQAVAHYRRNFIIHVLTLTYLDDRPVSDNERGATVAWARGGVDAERAERDRQRQEERDEMKRNFDALAALQREHRERRRLAGEDVDKEPTFADPAIQRFHDDMVAKVLDEDAGVKIEEINDEDVPALEEAGYGAVPQDEEEEEVAVPIRASRAIDVAGTRLDAPAATDDDVIDLTKSITVDFDTKKPAALARETVEQVEPLLTGRAALLRDMAKPKEADPEPTTTIKRVLIEEIAAEDVEDVVPMRNVPLPQDDERDEEFVERDPFMLRAFRSKPAATMTGTESPATLATSSSPFPDQVPSTPAANEEHTDTESAAAPPALAAGYEPLPLDSPSAEQPEPVVWAAATSPADPAAASAALLLEPLAVDDALDDVDLAEHATEAETERLLTATSAVTTPLHERDVDEFFVQMSRDATAAMDARSPTIDSEKTLSPGPFTLSREDTLSPPPLDREDTMSPVPLIPPPPASTPVPQLQLHTPTGSRPTTPSSSSGASAAHARNKRGLRLIPGIAAGPQHAASSSTDVPDRCATPIWALAPVPLAPHPTPVKESPRMAFHDDDAGSVPRAPHATPVAELQLRFGLGSEVPHAPPSTPIVEADVGLDSRPGSAASFRAGASVPRAPYSTPVAEEMPFAELGAADAAVRRVFNARAMDEGKGRGRMAVFAAVDSDDENEQGKVPTLVVRPIAAVATRPIELGIGVPLPRSRTASRDEGVESVEVVDVEGARAERQATAWQ